MEIAVLDPSEFDQLRALERRVTATDGITLKLEWASITGARTIASLVCREAGSLVGFLGLYPSVGPAAVELMGMVDPTHRRRGFATELLAQAAAICAQAGRTHRLLIVPRACPPAVAFAQRCGAALEHSEHSLVLGGPPRAGARNPNLSIRDATPADGPELIRLLSDGFGGPVPADMTSQLRGCVILEYAGRPIGTARLSFDEQVGAVHGFAVDSAVRGRGLGRDALGRFCEDLRARGAERIRLEVAVENERALGLYTSIGFAPVGTEDYYLLP